jgi:hypothetical protein
MFPIGDHRLLEIWTEDARMHAATVVVVAPVRRTFFVANTFLARSRPLARSKRNCGRLCRRTDCDPA